MEETRNNKVGFINSNESGMWGNLTWDNGVKYLIRSIVRKGETDFTADIQVETGNVYLNKAGRQCKEYKKVGFMKFNANAGTLVLDLDGKITKESFMVVQEATQEGTSYLRLSFKEPNPYEKYLMEDTGAETTQEVAGSELPELDF